MPIAAVWIGALVLVPAATLFHVLQPRVPLYQFRVNGLPWFRFRSGEKQHGLQTTLDAQVIMQNDNFVSTAIHAIAFDLYYPTWDGTLHNIGHVVDQQQKEVESEEIATSAKEAGSSSTTASSSSSTTKAAPLWVMQAREAFQTTDQVHLTLWIRKLWHTFTHLIYQAVRGGGSLQVPSTGVVHVKAAGSTKLTLSMICDNILNAFTMAMEGKECLMHRLTPGWVDLHEEAERMRQHVMMSMDKSKDGLLLPPDEKRGRVGEERTTQTEGRPSIEQPPALLLA